MTCVFPAPLALADLLDLVEIALAPLARRLPAHVAREDLASAGKLALVAALPDCAGSLDEVRAYCFVRVRGAMLDELRRLDPLSRSQRERANIVAKARAALTARLGRAPTAPEIAATAGLPVAAVLAVPVTHAFADPIEVEWDTLPDHAALSPAESLAGEDLRASLHAALDRLPANQALALRRYYLEDATLDAIAAELGVSRERARQVREAGEKKLRADFVVLTLWQGWVARREQ